MAGPVHQLKEVSFIDLSSIARNPNRAEKPGMKQLSSLPREKASMGCEKVGIFFSLESRSE